jgi:hypothetical protein
MGGFPLEHFVGGAGGLLGGLPYLGRIETRMVSPENPTGAKGAGATRVPDPSDPDLPHSGAAVPLGKGWKVRPFVTLPAGETLTLADLDGPGAISYIWITSDLREYRRLALRACWDDETEPSIEAPLGDFFGMGHDDAVHEVSSLPVVVAPKRGLNCWWRMPFRHHARLTLTNDGDVDANIVAYKIVYHRHDVPDAAAYLHAQWRRSVTTREHPEHTILDGVRGSGHYVGTSLAWTAGSGGWWGEGEVKFYLDGDGEYPTICDTGTEDYFGGAWGFYRDGVTDRTEQPYSTPFLGLPLASNGGPESPRRFSLYRWHLLDPIGFDSDLRVTVQTLGWYPDKTYQPLTDDIASLALWYQREPHAPFPAFPPLRDRWSR